MSPPEEGDEGADSEVGGFEEFLEVEGLATVEDGTEGDDGGAIARGNEGLAVLLGEAIVTVPDGENMVGDQAEGGDEGEGGAEPEGMGDAPDHLAHHLGVAGDANDAGFVEVDFGFSDRGNFEQIKRGGIEKQKGNRAQNPHRRLHTSHTLHLPEGRPVVAMVKEVDDQHRGKGNTHEGKADAIETGPDQPFAPGSQGSKTAMGDRKSDQQGRHHRMTRCPPRNIHKFID